MVLSSVAAEKRPGIRIVEIQGTVEISPAGAQTWVLTQTNQVLHPHDRLRTGANSRAALLWSDQSVVPLGAVTEIEIQPPQNAEAESGLFIIRGVISFFHRDKPGRIRIITRGAIAGIEGTEFVMAVKGEADNPETTVSVIDGKVSLSDPAATVTLLLTNREQAVVTPGELPRRTAGFIANNLLQWCFYYPGVLDIKDLSLATNEQNALRESLAAYHSGDLLAALAAYPAGQKPDSDNELLYHAALLLSVGQIETAKTNLASVVAKDSSSQNARLAAALHTLIASVRRDETRVPLNPQLSTELLAASYYEQSRATGGESLKNALDLARRATSISPHFGFAWERVAELEFSFGQTDRALEALNRSLEMAPRNAQALALKGFLLAAQNRTHDAYWWFEDALALDSALGNAWLGRGLCRIHHGDFAGGREDLLIATALEPQRAALRSYLGKAWSASGDDERAQKEFGLARQLDPNDPTSWLYSALNHQNQNRINQAVRDLEKSQQLNDNRSVYRSQLLLDQDRAVRSASLASIYRDNGMNEVSLREAASAVTADYANYSAHLFLANSFDTLRDPTRFNLRYETPWFNELLLANLLAPAGVPTLSQDISQQEYSRLFERDRFGLTTTTDLRSDGQYREVASQFGTIGKLSYALDLDWQSNKGVRPNNELRRAEWYTQIKYQITPRDSMLLLTKYQDYHSGDNFQYYDPNASFRPAFNFDEYQKPIMVGAYHREWAPGIHTLALGGRLENDQRLSDRAVPLFVLTRGVNGLVNGVFNSNFNVDYRSELETWIGELNQIFKTDRNTLVVGGRYQTGSFETQNRLTNSTAFAAFFPGVEAARTEDMQRWSLYWYDTLEVLPAQLWLTAGVAYDVVDYPANFRQVPIAAGQARESCFGPKAAIVWRPDAVATVRGAYSRSLGGVSLDESYRLEPSQLAGFNQSYRTIIPESVVGSVAAPQIDSLSAALDLKLPSQTYLGLIGEALASDVDRVLGVYQVAGIGIPSSTPQSLRYHEYSALLVVNQLLSTEWAVGVSYKYTHAELEQSLPEVPIPVSSAAQRSDTSGLHNAKLYALYSHASGFFARAEADSYWQENRARTYNSSGNAINTTLPHDQFCQLNFWLGYRLRKGMGDISIGLLNATDTDYKLNPLNTYAELPRERVVAARVRFRF